MKRHTSTYSVGSVDLPWQQGGMDIEPLASVTTNPTPKQSLKSTGQTCRATKTSAKYEASYTQESLFSQEDSLASHSVSLGSKEARTMTAISGQKCLGLYAKQGQLGSLVRMLLASSTWHSTKCILTWKQKATKSSRLLFQLAVSMRRTGGTESGLSDVTKTTMWPTPRACDLEGGVSKATNMGGGWYRENQKGERWGVKLKDAVHSAERLWPTPSSRDGKGGYRGGRMRNGKIPRDTLDVAVQHEENQGKQSGQLNPEWVAWLMGYPTEWLNCVDSEMPSSRKSRQKLLDASTK